LADNQLTPVTVTTGLDDGDNVELLSGDVKPGDAVVIDEARKLASSAAAPPSFAAPHLH